jgi:hypothetical protein
VSSENLSRVSTNIDVFLLSLKEDKESEFLELNNGSPGKDANYIPSGNMVE